MVDEKTRTIITGLIVFAIGVIIAAVGTIFEEAAQTAAFIIGGVAAIVGIIILYRGMK